MECRSCGCHGELRRPRGYRLQQGIDLCAEENESSLVVVKVASSPFARSLIFIHKHSSMYNSRAVRNESWVVSLPSPLRSLASVEVPF